MATRATIKANYETGDIPDQAEYEQWIDSTFNKDDDFNTGILKFSVNFAAFQPNATPGGSVTVFAAPALSLLVAAQLNITTAWTGAPIASASLELRAGTANAALTGSVNGLPAAGGTIGTAGIATSTGILDTTGADTIELVLVTPGGVIDNLVSGDIDGWLLVAQLP